MRERGGLDVCSICMSRLTNQEIRDGWMNGGECTDCQEIIADVQWDIDAIIGRKKQK